MKLAQSPLVKKKSDRVSDGKAGCFENIVTELLKVDRELFTQMLHEIIKVMCEEEQVHLGCMVERTNYQVSQQRSLRY